MRVGGYTCIVCLTSCGVTGASEMYACVLLFFFSLFLFFSCSLSNSPLIGIWGFCLLVYLGCEAGRSTLDVVYSMSGKGPSSAT